MSTLRPLDCEEADVLLAAYAVGSLDSADGLRLREHLAGCAGCRRVGAEYAGAAALLPLGLPEVAPPPGLRTRLLATVSAEAHQHRAPRPGLLQRLWTAVPRSRAFTIAAPLAAAVAVAVALHQPSAPPAPRAPGVVSVRLGGTTAEPGAQGTMEWNPTSHVVLFSVEGLPAQAAGAGQSAQVYEIWLIRRNNTPQAAAFLTRQPGGRVWSGVTTIDSMSPYRAVAATVEPAAGSDAPTGPEVLAGEIGT